MAEQAINAAIRFERDAYDMGQPWLMGRQAAGHGFLRAAVAGRGDGAVIGYGAPAAAPAFSAMVTAIDPRAKSGWIPHNRPEALGAARVCYRPDPLIEMEARLRLRAGPSAYSLCGVTHTTATSATMTALANLFTAPLMPWDAVICTSRAVVRTIGEVQAAEADYLRWRFGPDIPLGGPQLPLIPLGVHCDDFAEAPKRRVQARRALGIGSNEIVALFVGRLAFSAKMHPAQTMMALQQAHLRTGQPLVLVLCGWSPSESISQVIQEAARGLCPDVRLMFIDGRDPDRRDRCLAAADLFMSLSDNVQETFGLTPVEAMAAGLPVIVSDWNGYRDTVRHGVDGFLTPTWMPGPGAGAEIARDYEAGILDYDNYIWRSVAATSCASAELLDQLCALVSDPELRARMGAAGARRAREDFDWSVIYPRYQALWAELDARRLAAPAGGAPTVSPRAQDPYRLFGHYPTRSITPETRVAAAPGATKDELASRLALRAFGLAAVPPALTTRVFDLALDRRRTVAELAASAGCSAAAASHAAGLLAKMELVVLEPPAG
jgi:glycosyltransferase involved in cell wall biosynthesis